MTSQLVILGNGFDLQCGLKSIYENFFCHSFLDTYSEQCGFPTSQKDCKGFWEKLLFEYYKQKINIGNKWCNVETIIKEIIWQICYGSSNGKETINHGVWKSAYNYSRYQTDNLAAVKSTEQITKFLFLYCSSYFDWLKSKGKFCSEKEYLNFLIRHLLQEIT